MPFPLPIDPDFRKEIIAIWLDDFEDMVDLGRLDRAGESLRTAKSLYLGLPAGHGDDYIEKRLVGAGVKLVKHQSM
jgi:hypothetical protein